MITANESHILRCYSHVVDKSTKVGVLDKAVAILDALEIHPLVLNDLSDATGIPRPTAHRLALAMEQHGLIARNPQGQFHIGGRVQELAEAAGKTDLARRSLDILTQLRDDTGESAQLYQRVGEHRVCTAAVDLASGLRDTVPQGAALTMSAGSAAQVLLAWGGGNQPSVPPATAAFSVQQLRSVRQRGWAASIGEREPEVASVSAPVLARNSRALAAVSISGPVARFGESPGERFAHRVMEAGRQLAAV